MPGRLREEACVCDPKRGFRWAWSGARPKSKSRRRSLRRARNTSRSIRDTTWRRVLRTSSGIAACSVWLGWSKSASLVVKAGGAMLEISGLPSERVALLPELSSKTQPPLPGL